MSQLTEQHKRLHALEIVIEEGKQTFIQVGNALSEIKEEELYKATHKTFEMYCRERWGFSKTYANNIVRASAVVKSLPEELATMVATERQARALSEVPMEERPAVLERAQAVAASEGRPLIARDIENAAPVKPAPLKTEPIAEPVKVEAVNSPKRAYSPEMFFSDVSGSADLARAEFTVEEQKRAAGHMEMEAAKIRHNIRKLALTNSSQSEA